MRAILLLLALLALRALGPYGVAADSGVDLNVTNYRVVIVRCCDTGKADRVAGRERVPASKRRRRP
jgi:hypothetical protein